MFIVLLQVKRQWRFSISVLDEVHFFWLYITPASPSTKHVTERIETLKKGAIQIASIPFGFISEVTQLSELNYSQEKRVTQKTGGSCTHSEIQWDNSFPQQKTTKKFDRINFPTKVLKNILSLYPCFHTSIRQGICAEGDLQPIRRLGCWLQPGSQESDPQKSFCKWHQYGISIQSSTKLRETFRQITPKLWATKTWDWDKLFIH